MQEMVTISIVTYNSRYIFNVLDQLKAELGTNSIYDIHIYDNHSETAYLEKLTTYEPFITIHLLTKGHTCPNIATFYRISPKPWFDFSELKIRGIGNL